MFTCHSQVLYKNSVNFLAPRAYWTISSRIFRLNDILSGFSFPEPGACNANWRTKQSYPEGIPIAQVSVDLTTSNWCCKAVPRLANWGIPVGSQQLPVTSVKLTQNNDNNIASVLHLPSVLLYSYMSQHQGLNLEVNFYILLEAKGTWITGWDSKLWP